MSGYDLVFATSFGYGDPIEKVAPNYPDTVFMHATGYKTAENVGTYFGAAEEARYLTGIAAGKATKNGKIGYVAAFPIPEVLRGINAFTLGVQSVNPDRDGAGRVDVDVVRSRHGEASGREPDERRCGRARDAPGLARDR